MGLISTVRSWISGAPQEVGSPRTPKSNYMRGGRGITFAGWNPALRDADKMVAGAWDKAAARAVDAIVNSGWLSGAIEQATANTVGVGLRLKAQPENSLFGMSDADANAWARLVESRFELWSRSPYECDVEGRRTFGQMQAAALKSWFAFGEVFAELPWRTRPGGAYGTKVRLISPHRVSRKNDVMRNVVSGVRMDQDGMPRGYIAVRKEPMGYETEYEVAARDGFGRVRVIHVFDGAIGTVRGITPLVPALQVARQFDQLSDATLMAAIVQTVFAATITSETPTEEVLSGLLTPQEMAQAQTEGLSAYDAFLEAQAGWYEQSVLNVGINGRIGHLFPGQKMEFHTAAHPTSTYRDFSLHLLREIARCLGLTYESATGDYEGATYSSVRMATGEIFEITRYRRANVISPFCQPAYEAWLEEEIERGRIPFPGGMEAFMANRTAACRALWRGTPKPQADDLKTAKSHEIWKRLGVMSDEMIASDIGADIEDVYMQRQREKDLRTRYGLDDPAIDPVTGQAIETEEPAREDEDV